MTEPPSLLCRCCGTLLPPDVLEIDEVAETREDGETVVCELCQAGADHHVHP